MKLVIAILLSLSALQAQAGGDGLKRLIPIIIGGIIDHNRPAPYPYPGPGYPPPHSGYPSGPVTCTAADRGWEEHAGGHYSCGECVAYHGNCLETCRSNDFQCTVEGRDAYGRVFAVHGRGYDRWQAENEALRNCRYQSYAGHCYVRGCNQQTYIVSQRSCR